MILSIRAHGLDLGPALRLHGERRVERALNKHRGVVRDVAVQLTDVNGPRGGRDVLCSVVAQLDGHPAIVVRALADDAYASIDLVAPKLAEAVVRRLGRARSTRLLQTVREPESRHAGPAAARARVGVARAPAGG
jgi:putative sigma-54 modulation protein